MSLELAAAVLYFILMAFALLFSLTRSSHIEKDNFPNRSRFYFGLAAWVVVAILAIFMSFPGYQTWFVASLYPILKISLLGLFLVGFFLVLTTLIAFPQHISHFRHEIDSRTDRVAFLENVRQIASQPYPITESFSLVLKELGSFLALQKGAIFLINPSRRELYLAAQIGLDKDELGRLERFALGKDIVSLSATEQSPYISGDLAASDSASRALLLAGRNGTMSAAAIPLVSRDRSLGTLLMLSSNPYRFEKHDRMLMLAAADVVAAVIENNRLARDNQKMTRLLEESANQLDRLREGIHEIVQGIDHEKTLVNLCRYLVLRNNAIACQVVRVDQGDMIVLARFEIQADVSSQSQSYRVAVIDAIRRRKMVALNQEARDERGGTYIRRTALLCPFSPSTQGDYALLLEAPGNALPLTDRFLTDVEGIVNLVAIAVDIRQLKTGEILSQTAINSLLGILRIDPNVAFEDIARHFAGEIDPLLPTGWSALIVGVDRQRGYRILQSCRLAAGELIEIVFNPGEGPVGKAAASGDMREYHGKDQIARAWGDLEQVNQDFLNQTFGERGLPQYELDIPVRILNEVAAVVVLFSHAPQSTSFAREKGLVLLAAQLLSIRLTAARVGGRHYLQPGHPLPAGTGETLNQLNNQLATIVGQAQLMQHQPDSPGPIRYSADEILAAADAAAASVKQLQAEIESSGRVVVPPGNDLSGRLNLFLESRHISGNLYVFDDNRTVMLRNELAESLPFSPHTPDLYPFVEAVLRLFITLREEGEEVMVKSDLRGGYFYLSLLRGTREQQTRFDPTARDYGDPDVLPRELADSEALRVLIANGGTVSFDRFGRRPTYLAFRFPCPGESTASQPALPVSAVAGLKMLAIDDQQMILDLLMGICQSVGIELTAVREPAEGVALFKRGRFDVVMVDLALGQVSGWDIAGEIKRHAPETPVILMTGWGMNIGPEDAARAGVDFTLSKPFRIEQLTDIILQAKTRLLSR